MEAGEQAVQVSTDPKPFEIPEEYDSFAAESLSFVTGAILDESVVPETAASLARNYTIHTALRLQEILDENPGRLSAMKDFKETLEEAVEESRNGDFTNIARFLTVEAERLGAGMDPELNEYAPIGNKIREMIKVLPTKV